MNIVCVSKDQIVVLWAIDISTHACEMGFNNALASSSHLVGCRIHALQLLESVPTLSNIVTAGTRRAM